MKNYDIYSTEDFDREMNSLEKIEQERINKLFLKLKENPYTGDPLSYKFFREKRINGKRVYFLIFDDFNAVLFVAFSDKKTQQETIDSVINKIDQFKFYLKEKIKG
ncbi:hypothetical protein COU57_01930 [Candidatus Pacearchaeota archaeon CG10_big_fil_rev_8_21_14_0_10_32_14]|nr:MAG: hypothetical protein COU57_01930 [Candidatus Pacearchaeota archaeon CG10_big_fil_rev_8_21_14_0_10_32_14]